MVSIVTSKVNKSHVFRLNFTKKNLPEGQNRIILKVDKHKGRIGVFKAIKDDEGRRVTPYGKKTRLVYISCPRIIGEIGFKKGRYEIIRKSDNPDIYFYISVNKPIETAAENKEEKTEGQK